MTISAKSLTSDASDTHFKNLVGITSTSTNVTATIADDADTIGSTLDLTQFTSVSGSS